MSTIERLKKEIEIKDIEGTLILERMSNETKNFQFVGNIDKAFSLMDQHHAEMRNFLRERKKLANSLARLLFA